MDDIKATETSQSLCFSPKHDTSSFCVLFICCLVVRLYHWHGHYWAAMEFQDPHNVGMHLSIQLWHQSCRYPVNESFIGEEVTYLSYQTLTIDLYAPLLLLILLFSLMFSLLSCSCSRLSDRYRLATMYSKPGCELSNSNSQDPTTILARYASDPDQQRVFVSHSQTLEEYFLTPPFLFTDMTSNWVRQLPHPSPNSPSSLGHICWSCTCWRLWKGWVWTRLHRTLYKKKLIILPSLLYGFLDLEVLFHW